MPSPRYYFQCFFIFFRGFLFPLDTTLPYPKAISSYLLQTYSWYSLPSQLMATSSLHLNKPNPWRHLLSHSFTESMTTKPLVLNIFRIEPVLNPFTTLILNHNMMVFYFCIFDSYLNDLHSILASSNISSVYQPA